MITTTVVQGITETMARRDALSVVGAGVVLAALAWIDPLFIPLVLLGPVMTGVVWSVRRESWRGPALTWTIAGAGMLISDWVVNNEDQIFHVVVTLLMVGLLRLAHLLASLPRRRNR